MILGTIRSDDSNGNENVKKAIGLKSKPTICSCIRFFCTFLWNFVHDYNVKVFYTNLCFMEDVKKLSTNKILLLFLNFDNAVGNSTPGEFAYI